MSNQVTTIQKHTNSPQAIIEAANRALACNSSEKEASFFATLLLESWHPTAAQAAGDASVIFRQFVDLFMHYPVTVLKKITSAYDGLPAKSEWRPSLAVAKVFLDDSVSRIVQRRDAARAMLTKPPVAVIAPEERERRAKLLQGVADHLRRQNRSLDPRRSAPDWRSEPINAKGTRDQVEAGSRSKPEDQG